MVRHDEPRPIRSPAQAQCDVAATGASAGGAAALGLVMATPATGCVDATLPVEDRGPALVTLLLAPGPGDRG